MNIDNLQLPEKGFTKLERAYLRDVIIPALKTVRAIQGKDVAIINTDNNQIISASDCSPCP